MSKVYQIKLLCCEMKANEKYFGDTVWICFRKNTNIRVRLIFSSSGLISSSGAGLLLFYIAFRDVCGSRELHKTV